MSTTDTDIRTIALGAIAAAAGLEPDQVARTADIFDLGIDSLDFWKVLMDVEDGIGMEVPAHVLDRLAQLQGDVTVDDLLTAFAVWHRQAGADVQVCGEPPLDVLLLDER
jgi:acyl carrier protein